jgi:hypothetical protein
MVAFPHVYALVMALEIRLADEFLAAVTDSARERVFALLIVRLHMGLEVVAPAEQLATTLDLALEVGFGLGRQPARRPPGPRYT